MQKYIKLKYLKIEDFQMYKLHIYLKNPRVNTPINSNKSLSRRYIPPKSTSPFPLQINNIVTRSRELEELEELLSKFTCEKNSNVSIIYAFYEVDEGLILSTSSALFSKALLNSSFKESICANESSCLLRFKFNISFIW